MGKRTRETPQTDVDIAALSLEELEVHIHRAKLGYGHAGTSQSRKAYFKRLIWLEAKREELHHVEAPKRRFNSG